MLSTSRGKQGDGEILPLTPGGKVLPIRRAFAELAASM